MPATPAVDLRAERLDRLAAARLYLVCDAKPGQRTLAEVLPAAIAGGVDIVQLRIKHVDDDRLLQIARQAQEICARQGALFIVNDRPLVARDSGADGVHVGQDDMPVAHVREIVGRDMLIGLSTHAPAEIDAIYAIATTDAPATEVESGPEVGVPGTARDRPDYIGVGPVHATPTKLGRAAVGTELVRYAAAHARVPFFAIGGLDAGNVGDVLAAGASRVCVLRAIADAADPGEAARELRRQIDADLSSSAIAGSRG